MRFIKMHGIGNDYVYFNTFETHVEDPAAFAREHAPAICDRHKGIGADGLIFVTEPDAAAREQGAQVRMRMFNADGSESEMCGNGVRCVCKLAYDHNVTPGIREANPMRVQTGNGVLSLAYTLDDADKVAQVTVDMGEPIRTLSEVPVDESAIDAALDGATYVSMGNPHAVFFVDDVQAVDVATLGETLENHKAFPRRMNLHWVQRHSERELTMRTWERGSGITQACGTGASAVCVAGVLQKQSDRTVLIHLSGGDLTLEWRESNNHVYMTGPAEQVFVGQWQVS